jgi:hypothetical protein
MTATPPPPGVQGHRTERQGREAGGGSRNGAPQCDPGEVLAVLAGVPVVAGRLFSSGFICHPWQPASARFTASDGKCAEGCSSPVCFLFIKQSRK